MKTWFVEAKSTEGNWGKFMLGVFDEEEWDRRSSIMVDGRLLIEVGISVEHLLVFDLQTCEGAVMRPGGHAGNDLDKHAVWVCPLFQPFLEWLWDDYTRRNITGAREHATLVSWLATMSAWLDDVGPIVDLSGVPLQTAGYRRLGPNGDMKREHDRLYAEAIALEEEGRTNEAAKIYERCDEIARIIVTS